MKEYIFTDIRLSKLHNNYKEQIQVIVNTIYSMYLYLHDVHGYFNT